MYKLTSNRVIPFYVPGGKKIYFKRVDIVNWILSRKVKSASEIEQETDKYLSLTTKG